MIRRYMFLFALGALVWASPAARAQPVTFLWGVESSCQAHGVYTEAARKGVRADLLPILPIAGAPPAAPEAAGSLWKAACPVTNGRLLGGHVERLGSFQRVRLWLHDPSTGKTVVADRFCDSHPECDLGAKIEQTAGSLVGDTTTGQEPGPVPTFCRNAAPAPTARSAQRSEKVHLVLLSERRLRESVLAALRAQVKLSARELLIAEGKSAAPDELRRALGSDPSGQALAVQVDGEGALLTVYDGPTGQAAPLEVQCTGCDKEKLAEKIAQGALKLLDTCFDEQCRQSKIGANLPPPPEVCVPWQAPACSEDSAAASAPSPQSITPGLARATKGAVWGLFGVGAATTAVLFGLNTSLTSERNGTTFTGILTQPAYTAAGFTALSLAVAIPITVLVNRASSPRRAEPRMTNPGAPKLSCPSAN